MTAIDDSGRADPQLPDIQDRGWLAAARGRSERLLEAVAGRTLDIAPAFVCVAAAGSVGRLEAGPAADLDTLFVVETADEAGTGAVREAVEAFLDRLTPLPLAAPKPTGIFRRAVARHELLTAATRGRIDESPHVFGPRIQMLLDARPIHHVDAFRELRRAILDWYTPRPRLAVDGVWSFLVGDLVRYAHAYRNWQRFKVVGDATDSWALRQAKLHSCRFMTWLGLYAVLLRAAEEEPAGGAAWLAAHLDLPPVERVAVVCRADDPGLAAEIVSIYGAMLAYLADPGVRTALVHAGGPPADDADWEPCGPLLHLVRLAGELRGRISTWLAIRRRRGAPPDQLPF